MTICQYYHSGVLCHYATIITAEYYVNMPLSSHRDIMTICHYYHTGVLSIRHYHHSGVLCHYATIITAGYYVNMPLSSQRGIMPICHYHHSGVLCQYATIILHTNHIHSATPYWKEFMKCKSGTASSGVKTLHDFIKLRHLVLSLLK